MSDKSCSDDRRSVRTRAALLDSLLELTIENGYGRTTVADVLERAGVARSTFYHHFESKDDLLLGRFDLFRLAPAADREDGALPLPDVTPIFRHTGLYTDLYRSLRDTGDLDQLTDKIRGDLTASLTEAFEDLVVRGYALAGEPAFLASFFSGALVAVLYDWLDADAPGHPDEAAQRFESMMRRGVSGAPPPDTLG